VIPVVSATPYPGKTNSPPTFLTAPYTVGDGILNVDDTSVFPAAPNIVVAAASATDITAVTYRYAAIGVNQLTGVTVLEGTDKDWPINTPVARTFTNYDWQAAQDQIALIQDGILFKIPTIRADGDSFLTTNEDPVYSNFIFIDRVAQYYNLTLTNSGVGGTDTEDCITKIYGEVAVPSPYGAHALNIGINDTRLYYTYAGYQNTIANRISAMVAYLRLASIKTNTDASIAYTGSWSDDATLTHDNVNASVKKTTTTGDKATITFTGTAISIGGIVTNATPGTLTFKLDTVLIYTFTPSNPCHSAAVYCAKAFEFHGLADTPHSLVIENTDGGDFYLDWIGTPAAIPPAIFVNGICKEPTSGSYLIYSLNSQTASVNLQIQTTLAAFFDQRVIFCGMGDFDPDNYALIGSTHPTNMGHEWIAKSMIAPFGRENNYKNVREKLAAARTYYVGPVSPPAGWGAGSNSNNGLTVLFPFLTIQYAYDLIANTLDLNGYTVTIQIGDGTFTGGLLISKPWVGGGAVTVQGNTGAMSSVIISTTSASAISNTANLPGRLTVQYVKLTTATSGSCISNAGIGKIFFNHIEFGACAGTHLSTDGNGATINSLFGTYTISGNALAHMDSQNQGFIIIQFATITITGTPAFSTAFAYANNLALINAYSPSYTGSATGPRYLIMMNSVCQSGTTMPGDSAGSTATGGQYA